MDNSTASDNAFTHEPLADPAKYLRLLEVLDDKYSKTIKVRCRLTTWPINSSPPYHAISYTWGDAESNTTILMNDQNLRVRANCEFALRQVYRYGRSESYWYRRRRTRWNEESRPEWYTKSRYYWLDAICIDQANLGEKSKQVAMMGTIYKKASHVLACIGNHADDSLFFFQTLYGPTRFVVPTRELFKPDKRKAYREENGNNGVSLRFLLLHRHSTTHRFVLALARLAVRPYFTRMWILQELQHAQHITILCGQYVLQKEDAICLFEGLFHSLVRFDDNSGVRRQLLDPPDGQFVNRRFLRRLVNQGLPSPIWHGDWIYWVPKQCMATLTMLKQHYLAVSDNMFLLLKDVVRQLQCADPRDKVYGLVSLIDWGSVPPLEPDYTHTDLEVAVKFIKTLMELEKVRDIGEPIWKYMIMITKIFNLHTGTQGLVEALEARRVPPNGFPTGTATMPSGGPKVHLQEPGWRLLPEHIDKSISWLQGFQASPPEYPGHRTFLLPRWARADDWVIQVGPEQVRDLWYDRRDYGFSSQPMFTPLLIMRGGNEGNCGTFIGYGFYGSMDRTYNPSFKDENATTIDVHFDIEDAIILLWRRKQLFELVVRPLSDPSGWVLEYLSTGFCKRRTPGSSYAKLPSDMPARSRQRNLEQSLRALPGRVPANGEFNFLKFRLFVLWDTEDRRGWLVNGEEAALHLVCAYLRNVPQAEPFDFSKLNHFGNKTPSAAMEILCDVDNLDTSFFRVFKGDPEKPEDDESSKDLIEKKSLGEVVDDICMHLMDMNPASRFPAEYYKSRWGEFPKPGQKPGDIIMKGWDFERIYHSNKKRVFVHKFDKDPGWFRFVKDLRPSFLFGRDLGEVIQPYDRHRCPYFKTLPKGQDYLAAGLHTIQKLFSERFGRSGGPETVARLTYDYAWEHDVEPFSHLLGQGDHLDEVDSSCFPVQRFVKTPNADYNRQEKDKKLLQKRKGRPYSVQDVEDMHVVFDGDLDEATYTSAWKNKERSPKPGLVVFGNKPDTKKLGKLAQANLQQSQASGEPHTMNKALVAMPPSST